MATPALVVGWANVPPADPSTPVKLMVREDANGRVGLIRMAPGTVVPVHTHAADEVFVFIAGTATVALGEQDHTVGAGDVVCFPAGVPHGIVAGSDEVRFVAVVAPNDLWTAA